MAVDLSLRKSEGLNANISYCDGLYDPSAEKEVKEVDEVTDIAEV